MRRVDMQVDVLEHANVATNLTMWATSAAAAMIYEYACTLDYEINNIWPRVFKSNIAKCYLLARYAGLVALAMSTTLSFRMSQGAETPELLCKGWFYYQASIIQLLTMVVDYHIMLRTYLIFEKRPIVLRVLRILGGCEFVSLIASAGIIFPKLQYSITCLNIKAHRGFLVYGICALFVHCIFCGLAVGRYYCLKPPYNQNRLMLISIRDIAVSSLVIAAILLVMVWDVSKRSDPTSNIAFHFLLSAYWVIAGRLVTNLHELDYEGDPFGVRATRGIQTDGDIETSDIELRSIDFMPVIDPEQGSDAVQGSSSGACPTPSDTTWNPTLEPADSMSMTIC
ncbi:hypothetical protein CONPUDRAFT_140207 [Coniophora puteana RWD-64-598 SS2]|uniref:DUF6533 domain-containing protein n=1 Tax=Coniophora puteana (strain RWD-64-598) TaxID=741705 RepID=A0A5M3M8G0_CONPW|nr:uncharacterized protein CONPUDRAFT_140207 [Coniophora puteana RWD-64-598 SS2]EIW75327.1 hypothetical protein CONPUDRAFT_140207 [Coniophora puteana RWD-64-598 SS2]